MKKILDPRVVKWKPFSKRRRWIFDVSVDAHFHWNLLGMKNRRFDLLVSFNSEKHGFDTMLLCWVFSCLNVTYKVSRFFPTLSVYSIFLQNKKEISYKHC